MLPVANNTISAFSVSSYPNVARVSSESVVLQEPHPQCSHNGGTIAAPGGLLYVSIGNGGHKNDPGPGYAEEGCAANTDNNGQEMEQNLRGNVLCMDVNASTAGKGYAMPLAIRLWARPMSVSRRVKFTPAHHQPVQDFVLMKNRH
jgi:hypothetical protein